MEYEVFSMLSHGCKCTIGDQMDYWGKLNKDMYQQIGRVYKSVEEKNSGVRMQNQYLKLVFLQQKNFMLQA